MTVSNWVFEDNLLPVLSFIAGLVGYTFDDLDADAVRAGLAGTDAERGQWLEYPLGDAAQLPLRLAMEPGSSVVSVEAEASGDLAVEVRVALEIAQTLRLVARNPVWSE